MSFCLHLQAQVNASLSTYVGTNQEEIQELILQHLPKALEGFDCCLFHPTVHSQEEGEDGFDHWSIKLQMFGFFQSKHANDKTISKAQIECELLKGVYPKIADSLKQSLAFLPFKNNLIIHEFDDQPHLSSIYR